MDEHVNQTKDWSHTTEETEDPNESPWCTNMEYTVLFDSDGRGIVPTISHQNLQLIEDPASIPYESNHFQTKEQNIGEQSPPEGSTASPVSASKARQPVEQGLIPAAESPFNSSTGSSSESILEEKNSRRPKAKGRAKKGSIGAAHKDKDYMKCEDEKKREKNRLYATKSRQKKAEELSRLKEENARQESLIEIYKKIVSIYHGRLNGAPPTWFKHSMEWFPSQGTRHSESMTVECLLPDSDENFLSELGNSAYGSLCQTKSEASATSNVRPAATVTGSMAAKASSSFSTKVTKGNGSQTSKVSVTCHQSPICSFDQFVHTSHPQSGIKESVTQNTGSKSVGPTELPHNPLPSTSRPAKSQIPSHGDTLYSHKAPENNFVKSEDILKIINEVRQGTDNGEHVNVIYVMPQHNQLKRILDEPSASYDGIDAASEKTGPSSAKQKRVDDNHSIFTLNKEKKVKKTIPSFLNASNSSAVQFYQMSAAGTQSGSSLRNEAECSTSIPSFLKHETTDISNPVSCTSSIHQRRGEEQAIPDTNSENQNGERHMLFVGNETVEVYSTQARTGVHGNKLQEKNETRIAFPVANNPALQQSFATSKGYESVKLVKPNDSTEASKLFYKPQISNISLSDDNQNVPVIIAYPHIFDANKVIPATSVVSTHQLRNNKAEIKLQSNIAASASRLQFLTQSKEVSPCTLNSVKDRPISNSGRHVPERGNITENMSESVPKALTPTSLPVTTGSNQGYEVSSFLTPAMTSVSANNASLLSKEHLHTSGAVHRAASSPDENRTQYLQILNNTSGLSSLSSYDIETDHVELENIKPSFQDQT